jgi:hypothetical protein
MTPLEVRKLAACPSCGMPIRARCRPLHKPYGPPAVPNHIARTRLAEQRLAKAMHLIVDQTVEGEPYSR